MKFAIIAMVGIVLLTLAACSVQTMQTPKFLKAAFPPLVTALKGIHPWIGKVALKVRMDGCMASVETLENIGVIKEVYWQDEKNPGTAHVQLVRCGDYDGKPDFTMVVPRSTWFGNVLIERY